jgi:hypothetical protein
MYREPFEAPCENASELSSVNFVLRMARRELPHCAVREHLLSSTARVAIHLLERAMTCYGHDLMLARAVFSWDWLHQALGQ